MTLVEELQKWQTDLQALGDERAKAEGRYDQSLLVLRKLGFNTIEEAVKELEKRKQAKWEAEQEAEQLLTSFREKYAEHIK